MVELNTDFELDTDCKEISYYQERDTSFFQQQFKLIRFLLRYKVLKKDSEFSCELQD